MSSFIGLLYTVHNMMKRVKNIIILTSSIITITSCASSKPVINSAQQAHEQNYISQAQLSIDNQAPDEALAAIANALKIDKSNPNLYMMEAKAYAQKGDLNSAINSYTQAINIDNKNSLYLSALNTTKCELDPQYPLNEINQAYNQAIELAKDNNQADALAQIYADNGNCLLARNNNDDAINMFESSIATNKPPVSAYTGITQAYINEENYPKAALMISSVASTDQTRQVILLKIDALSGLLNAKYHIKESNRKLLISKIAQLNQQLQQPENIKNPTSITVVQDAAPESVIQPSRPTIITPVVKIAPTVVNKPKLVTVNKPTTVPQSLPPKLKNTTTGAVATPINTSGTFGKRIHKASNGRNFVIVGKGDTLFNIAKQSGLTQDELIKINHLKNDFVPLGNRLFLN
jgi:Tfp pilus assembly protein PilF/LysM repeat protein